MKKLLALVLALVMSMSLVTISNAAFKDADKISNKEAVDVMAAVGVLAGYDNGEFGATDTLTRAQACKIIAYLDLGKDVAEALPAVQVFSDLPASNWAAKYVAYCADAGYLSGVGDNKFAPDEKVTGYQFGKMLLCALGYDATIEEMTGASWTIKVAKLMEKNSISKGTSKLGAAVLTREEAAQYALNALKATCVEYDEKGSTITAGDVTIITGAKKAQAVYSGETYADDIVAGTPVDGKYTLQLGEKLYKGDLKKDTSVTVDEFNRPLDYKWTYKTNDDVYTVAKTALFTYTAETSAKNMLKDLKGWYIGSVASANKITAESDIAAYANDTANGKVVELYGDKDNKVINATAVEIEYAVAEITDISTNKAGDVTYTLSYGGSDITAKDWADDDKNTDTVKVYGKVAEDDIVTFTTTGAGTSADPYVQHIYPTTKVVGTQTQKTSDKITVSGTAYSVALGVAKDRSNNVAMTDFANKTSDNNYYLDQFGFVVKTSAIAEEKNYAVIDLIALMGASGTGSNQYAEAKLVFADGSTKTVKVTKIDSKKIKDYAALTDGTSAVVGTSMNTNKAKNTAFENKVVTYTVKNDEYTLKFVGTNPTSIALTSGVPTLSGSDAINSETVVVVKSGTTDTNAKFTAYTGYKAMPTVTSTPVSYATDDGKVVFVYVDAVGKTVSGAVTKTDVFYAISDDVTVTGNASDDNLVYAVEGILNGEKTTIKSEEVIFDNTGDVKMSKGYLYTVEFDGSGYVTKSTLQGAAGTDFVKSTVTTAAKNGLLVTNATTYTYDGTEKVVVIDSDGELVSGSITSASKDDVVYVKVVDKNAADGTAKKIAIDTIYIIQK